jgi:hypothetical protein
VTNIDAFAIRRVGTAGHEILDPDGNVVAWAVDEPWAMLIAAALNRAEAEGSTLKMQPRFLEDKEAAQ